jgi:nucleoside-diphosphate-sugar epimerase
MKIIVTGNMGYVGPVVVKHLRKTFPDATLLGVDTGLFASGTTNCDVLPECSLDHQYFVDVRNLPAVILEGVDAIVHLAAVSNDPIGNKYEDVTYDINYRATVDLAEQAKKAGVKHFVFASSCSVYGASQAHPRREDDPLNPLTAYARSKVMAETDLVPLADEDFVVTCLRFSTACGMSDRLRLDLVLNDFVASAVSSGKITILSDGTPWRPLINVKDMARAMEWALLRSPAQGGAFLTINVGSEDRNYQVRDVAAEVVKMIPGGTVEINENAPPDKRSYRVNFDLFKKLAPEHQPIFDLGATVAELKTGLQEMLFKDVDFRNTHFMRLNHLNYLRGKGYLNESLQWAGKT